MYITIQVSIIVPVYNVLPYLIESIDSIINQTYKNLEIILIDDGSTDGSGIICDNYAKKDNRIRVIHQENKGLSVARNVGLDNINGDVVAFLDSDDVYSPRFIENMMFTMLHKDVDVVICKYQVCRTIREMSFSTKEEKLPSIDPGKYDRIHALQAYASDKINPMVWNKIYKRTLWNNIRFPEGHVHEDIDTTFRIINLCGTIYALDVPLYLRRIRPNSITTSASKDNAEDCILAFNHFEKFVMERIPKVFNEEHLLHVKKMKLYWLVRYYTQLKHKNQSADKDYCEELRKQIIEVKSEIDSTGNELFNSIECWMLINCPFILRLIHITFKKVRMIFLERKS